MSGPNPGVVYSSSREMDDEVTARLIVSQKGEEALAKSALEQVGEEVCENTVVLSHLDNINAIFSPRLRGSGQTYRESSQKRRRSQVVMETPARLPRPVVMFELQAKEDDTT